jgi:hypothetical protein
VALNSPSLTGQAGVLLGFFEHFRSRFLDPQNPIDRDHTFCLFQTPGFLNPKSDGFALAGMIKSCCPKS